MKLQKMDEEYEVDVEDKRNANYWYTMFNYISQMLIQFNEAIFFTPKLVSQAKLKDSGDSE